MGKRKRNRARRRDKRLRRKLNKKSRSAISARTANLGPLTVTQAGNVLHLKSNLSASDLAEMHQRMREHRPELKDSIDKKVGELLELLASCNPLEIIAPLTLARQVRSPETSRESAETEPQADIDYLHSLAMAQPFPAAPKPVTQESLKRVTELLEEIRFGLMWFYMSEAAVGKHPLDHAEIRFKMLMSTMRIRGDGYWPIMRELYLGLFKASEAFLQKRFGFAAPDILATLEEAMRKTTERVDEHFGALRRAFLEWNDAFRAWATTADAAGFGSHEEGRAYFAEQHPAEEWGELQTYLDHARKVGAKEVLELVPADEAEQRILTALSMKYGENAEFLSAVPNMSGWPLGPTRVIEKPIISHASKFYMPDPAGFSRSLRSLTEALIREKDTDYFNNKYLRTRDRFLEQEVAGVFRAWFGDASVYTNLRYTVIEEGKAKDCELDCLATFGDAVFLIESKAGSFRPPARRGGLPSMMSGAKDLVAVAYEQASRAKRFVQDHETAIFRDRKDHEAVRVVREAVNHYFLITVTLEHLGFLTSHLPSLKKLDVIGGKTWPWSVSLPDLIAVQEVLDRPSLFLHYLHQRVPLNQAEHLMAYDELDMMIYYLEQGLWTGPEEVPSEPMYVICTHTDELDKYYLMKELGKPAKKPSRTVHPSLLTMLSAIERHPGEAGASCACALLDCDEETRTQIGEWISGADPQTVSDGGPHSLSLAFDKPGYALLIGCDTKPWSRERVRRWTRKWLAKRDIETAYIMGWNPPIASATVSTWAFR